MNRKMLSVAKRILAGIFAVVLVLSIAPVGLLSASAETIDTFTVKLSENIVAAVTLTDETDLDVTKTVNTDGNGNAIFSGFVDDTAVYTLTVTGMADYKDFSKAELTLTGTDYNVTLTAKKSQTIQFAVASGTKKYGTADFTNALSQIGDGGTGAITYSSSKESVAKINATGLVTLIGIGSTTITAVKAADDNYKKATASYTLTVEQGLNAISYMNTDLEYLALSDHTNVLDIKQGASGTITYSSDNTDVVSVDANGKVYVKKISTEKITITASFKADKNSLYIDSVASYKITARSTSANILYSVPIINTTFGDADGKNTLSKPADLYGGTLSFTSSMPGVATIAANGEDYHIVGAGTTEITATISGSTVYTTGEKTKFTLNVAKKDPALSFAQPSQTYLYGDQALNNILTNQSTETDRVTYSSSNESVATVDSQTGVVTLKKPSNVAITITASVTESANYIASSATYQITLNKKHIDLFIVVSKQYWQKDPNLVDNIKDQVKAQLIPIEENDQKIIDRVASAISYTYDGLIPGRLRPWGVYTINFIFTNDDYYSFSNKPDTTSTLTVGYTYEATEGAEYQCDGLNEDSWGSVKDTVVIRVTDSNKYQISKNNNDENGWSSSLVYNSKEGFGTHDFYILNIADEKVSKKATKSFGVDGDAPKIESFELTPANTVVGKVVNFLTFGVFCNESVKVTVNASDNDGPSSGIDFITLFVDGTAYNTNPVTENKATFTLDIKDFETLKLITAKATDKVGNTIHDANATPIDTTTADPDLAIIKSHLQIESFPPVITVNYADATSVSGNENWYGDDIALNVAVSDEGDTNSGIRSIEVKINGTDIKTASDGTTAIDTLFWGLDSKTPNYAFVINTSQVEEIPVDGKYTIDLSATDNAGTKTDYVPIEVYIDRFAPSITGFDFQSAAGVEGDESPVATIQTYGYFFLTDTTVVVKAKDQKPSGGINAIAFYTVDNEGKESALSTNKDLSVVSDSTNAIEVTASFNIKKGFKGQIYARAIDNVAHTTISIINGIETPKYFNPNGTVIEDGTIHPAHSGTTATLVTSTELTDNDGLPLYSADSVPVKLYVKDTFSGIKHIAWSVVSPYNKTASDPKGEANIDVNLGKTTAVGDIIDGWKVEAVDMNLVTEMSMVINVTNNSNNIAVNLNFNDRAGNGSTADVLYFSIDRTKPVISVTYDPNVKPDAVFTDFYNDNRTATIVIKERNFRPADVICTITNTDGAIPALVGWEPSFNTVDPDETTYKATVSYIKDGDYTFDIAYKDNAANAADTFAQHRFTMDQTAPEIVVSYINTTPVQNGNYYNKERTAVITITEHNFETGRIQIPGIATDNGNPAVFPAASAWEINGNTHTATIKFAADAKYVFDISYIDKAGNAAIDYTKDEFYIDQTQPALKITGVVNNTPYKTEVRPVITYSDTNFSEKGVTINLSGANSKAVSYAHGIAPVTNGQVYTFANLPEDKIVDDIYTLTATVVDFAGNEKKETVMFSVNRFGSVYVFGSESPKPVEGTYVHDEVAVVVTETSCTDLNVKDFKKFSNGAPSDLGSGVDYTKDLKPRVEGEWYQYTYTVKKAVFTSDAKYALAVTTEDVVGNVNESYDKRTDKPDTEFWYGVDKTEPQIVPVDLESDTQYPFESKELTAQVNDNLVLEKVEFLVDKVPVKTILAKDNKGDTFTYTLEGSKDKRNIQIVAYDAAGNSITQDIPDVLVTKDIVARWVNNTPLFIGSLVGVGLLAAGLITFIVIKKRKDAIA